MAGKSHIQKSKTFKGLSYVQLQKANSTNRQKLDKEFQKFLKSQKYRNIGWENVIALYEKIAELLPEVSLEDLFLESDRLGNKYLTPAEIRQAEQNLAVVLGEIEMEIDKSFLDTEIEIIDYRGNAR
jgi:hypothetical protein